MHSYIRTQAFQEKCRIDKGLIGNAGAIEKAFKEVEFLEEHALEKI